MNCISLKKQKGESKMNCILLKKQKGATKMKRGFTLIELLIVIAVISILIGIALPRFKGMQDEGNIAKVKGELRTLQTAVESYYIHNSNVYPTALSSLTSSTPTIVSAIPDDPFNPGSAYGYAQSTNVKYYVIYSKGTAGTSAAISDTGTVTETGGTTVIWVSNGGADTVP